MGSEDQRMDGTKWNSQVWSKNLPSQVMLIEDLTPLMPHGTQIIEVRHAEPSQGPQVTRQKGPKNSQTVSEQKISHTTNL